MSDDQHIEELARRVAAGDATALDELLAQIGPQVWLRRCQRFLPCQQDAEEACQDVLLQVATHIWARRPGEVQHLAVRGGGQLRAPDLPVAEATSGGAAKRCPAIDAPDPRRTSIIVSSRLDLFDALERLGADRPELVIPLVLRDVCQLDYAEIADYLGIPSGTLKSHRCCPPACARVSYRRDRC